MPMTPHIEKHFTASEAIRDIVIGMSDGLTVPFALAAGLSGAVAVTGIIVTAGLAEIVAGSIAMGLGGYLAAKTDAEHYHTERSREIEEINQIPHKEVEEVAQVFREWGMAENQIGPLVNAISSDRERWVDFMMRFELGLEKPDPARAQKSALTIALSYILGGMIPLSAYIFINHVLLALYVSVGVTLGALCIFGCVKSHFTGINPLRGGLQTMLIGGLAASAAFCIARLIS